MRHQWRREITKCYYKYNCTEWISIECFRFFVTRVQGEQITYCPLWHWSEKRSLSQQHSKNLYRFFLSKIRLKVYCIQMGYRHDTWRDHSRVFFWLLGRNLYVVLREMSPLFLIKRTIDQDLSARGKRWSSLLTLLKLLTLLTWLKMWIVFRNRSLICSAQVYH